MSRTPVAMADCGVLYWIDVNKTSTNCKDILSVELAFTGVKCGAKCRWRVSNIYFLVAHST